MNDGLSEHPLLVRIYPPEWRHVNSTGLGWGCYIAERTRRGGDLPRLKQEEIMTPSSGEAATACASEELEELNYHCSSFHQPEEGIVIHKLSSVAALMPLSLRSWISYARSAGWFSVFGIERVRQE